MNYRKKYLQVSKKAAQAKFRRMMQGAGRFGQSTFECAFSTWWMGKDDEFGDENYAIYVSTSYHSDSSLDEMYRTNCKRL